MDFGTIFISLIAFTIAGLVFPVALDENVKRNIAYLRESARGDFPIDVMASAPERARGLWNFLVERESRQRISLVRAFPHIYPVISVLCVEVIIFAYAAHRVARGDKTPGFIQDTVVGLAVLLILMSLYIAYRVVAGQALFREYLRKYEEYKDLWTQYAPR